MKSKILFICFITALIFLFAINYAEAQPDIKYTVKIDCTNIKTLKDREFYDNKCIVELFPTPAIFTLSWHQNPDRVDGYTVHVGDDISTPILFKTVLDEEKNWCKGITCKRPIKYTEEGRIYIFSEFSETELNWDKSRTKCFRLRAFNGIGISGYSDSICGDNHPINNVAYYINDIFLAGSPFFRVEKAPWYFKGKLIPDDYTITSLVTFVTGGWEPLKFNTSFLVKEPIRPNAPVNFRSTRIS